MMRRLLVDRPSTLMPLVDALLLALCSWLAYYTRWRHWDMPLDYLSVVILGTGLALVILPLTGAYRERRALLHWRDATTTLPGIITVTAILMIVGTLTKSTADFSRLWMGYWFLYTLAALFLTRWLAATLQRHFPEFQMPLIRILLIGDGPFALSIAEQAESAGAWNLQVVGLVSPVMGTNDSANEHGFTQMSLEEMEALIASPRPEIDEIWIAMESSAMDQQKIIIELLQRSCLTVRYAPALPLQTLLNHAPSTVAGMTLLELNASQLVGPNLLIKAAMDKFIAITALITLSPLFLFISILIKRDSEGPVFFKQPRHGWDGKIIQVLKFRTMYHNEDFADGAIQAKKNDPRITRIGRMLRHTSLDELPQFINVLKGDMSVVGPRPHPVALNGDYIDRIDAYMQRHRVKPGITGWAQIHGLRGETAALEKMQRRIEFDLYYIEHWSMWLDLRILAATIAGRWIHPNAY